MLINRNNEQTLSGYMRKSFSDRMLEHLQKFFPAKAGKMSEGELRAAIDDGLGRAYRYHLETEKDAAKFIDMDFITEPPFEELPEMKWAKEILRNDKLAGTEKMNRIYEQLPNFIRTMAEKKAK